MHNRIEPLIIFMSNEGWGSPFIYIKLNPIRPHNLISLIENEFKVHWPELPMEWEYLDAKYLSLYEKDYQVKNISEIGLAISIPLVVFGATLLVTLMDRYPVIITIGAGLIGWVAGEMLITDSALTGWLTGLGVQFESGKPYVGGWNLEYLCGALGVAFVVALGSWLAKRKSREAEPANS